MKKIELTLATAASKSEMHRAIDELPEDGEALLLTNSHESNRFVRLHMSDWGHVVYWLEYFKHAILSGDCTGLRENRDTEDHE